MAVIAIINALQCHAFAPSRTLLHQHQSLRSQSNTPARPPLAKKKDDDEGNLREGSLRAATKELGKVPYGEQSRKYRRTVFRHKDWVAHRSSSSRIISNLQSIAFSGVVRQLKPQVSAVASVAAFVLSWNWAATHGTGLPLIDNLGLRVLALPTLPFTLSSPALGLLLVFRTNAAYARWMCGRDAWSRIVGHAKNLVRMTSVFCPSDTDAVDDFSKVVWLYCRSIMNKLSSPLEDEEVYQEEVREVFQDSPIGENILSSSDRVISAWKELSIQLHSLPASDPKSLIETDKSIIILGECTAICEKIYSSPVPLVYTRHTARYLSVWALLLPCALYTAFSNSPAAGGVWAVLPASAIMAFFLFGVDELSMQLEEPFSLLPMQVFCDEIFYANKLLVGQDKPSLNK
ncbi:hypothetical protein ACHAXR_006366 [Thalassiosira sp. AJA248-18]